MPSDNPAISPNTQCPRLSVVVPCFNEEMAMAELERRLLPIAADVSGNSYEIILVNDGSTDATWAAMEALVDRHANIVCLNLSRNFGHQIAVTAGLEAARGDRVLLIDADLQDPPELLPSMMEHLDRGVDVVYGQRRERAGESFFKRFSAKCFYAVMSRVGDVAIPQNAGDFRLMSRRVVDAFLSMPETHRFVRGMIAWAGYAQVGIVYDRKARSTGKTKYTLSKMTLFAADAITGFSVSPLRLAVLFSLVSLVLAMLAAIYALYSWMITGAAQGWASIVCIILFFSSVQLFCLALIGEYVGRIYMQSKNRPLYFVCDVKSSAPDIKSSNAANLPKS